MAEFRERLLALRKQKNLSQAELAEEIGIGGQAISQYERGVRRPDLETLGALADFFNVSSDYLLGNTDVTVRLVNERELSVLEDVGANVRHFTCELLAIFEKWRKTVVFRVNALFFGSIPLPNNATQNHLFTH